ncbi:uncharacterized protein LOC142327534 [Lycorma delicatula]|uniref:uncharacterized protein LOC142327534 n=1 Tax=Lycorma delicatula TaxID=130591 RepID=UPI003F50E6AD
MRSGNLLMVFFIGFTINKLVKSEDQTGFSASVATDSSLGISPTSLFPNTDANIATEGNVKNYEDNNHSTNAQYSSKLENEIESSTDNGYDETNVGSQNYNNQAKFQTESANSIEEKQNHYVYNDNGNEPSNKNAEKIITGNINAKSGNNNSVRTEDKSLLKAPTAADFSVGSSRNPQINAGAAKKPNEKNYDEKDHKKNPKYATKLEEENEIKTSGAKNDKTQENYKTQPLNNKPIETKQTSDVYNESGFKKIPKYTQDDEYGNNVAKLGNLNRPSPYKTEAPEEYNSMYYSAAKNEQGNEQGKKHENSKQSSILKNEIKGSEYKLPSTENTVKQLTEDFKSTNTAYNYPPQKQTNKLKEKYDSPSKALPDYENTQINGNLQFALEKSKKFGAYNNGIKNDREKSEPTEYFKNMQGNSGIIDSSHKFRAHNHKTELTNEVYQGIPTINENQGVSRLNEYQGMSRLNKYQSIPRLNPENEQERIRENLGLSLGNSKKFSEIGIKNYKEKTPFNVLSNHKGQLKGDLEIASESSPQLLTYKPNPEIKAEEYQQIPKPNFENNQEKLTGNLQFHLENGKGLPNSYSATTDNQYKSPPTNKNNILYITLNKK